MAHTPMSESGFCAFPTRDSHKFCKNMNLKCTCECHLQGEEDIFDDKYKGVVN